MTVGPIVKEVMNFLRASLPSTIEIHQSIMPDAKPVLANSTRIHQVLMNLCANAGHSIREKGGVLSVVLDEVDIGRRFQWSGPQMVPGSYVRLTVSDTGCGIHPRVVDRIFEPYFTTKKAGEGTGLGLAIAVGIIKSYSGAITVKVELGRVRSSRCIYQQLRRRYPNAGSIRIIRDRKRTYLICGRRTLHCRYRRKMLAGLGYRVLKSRKQCGGPGAVCRRTA